MEIYFLAKPYNESEMAQRLLNIGFHKNEEYQSYEFNNPEIIINFTSSEEGRFQIQGSCINDLVERGSLSKHYSLLEKISEALNPNRIVDPLFSEIFPELTIG